MNHARTCDPNATGKSASQALKLDLVGMFSYKLHQSYKQLPEIHSMKKTAFRCLLVTVAGLAAALVPNSVLAAPGDLYEADNVGDAIFKFTPGGTKSTFASGLNRPGGLAFDGSGNLFEADNNSGTIFKFTPDG